MKDKRFYAPDSGADMVSDAVNAAALTGSKRSFGCGWQSRIPLSGKKP